MTGSCHISTFAKLEDIFEVHFSSKPSTVKMIVPFRSKLLTMCQKRMMGGFFLVPHDLTICRYASLRSR